MVSVVVLLVYLCIAIAVIAAWLLSIKLLIQVGEAKGYSMKNRGLLWFIGIFATPIATGLYVIALPDRSSLNNVSTANSNEVN